MKHMILTSLLTLSLATVAAAEPVTFSFTEDSRAASATFDASGGYLSIVLTNTSTFDVAQPDQLLTGVFFDLQGSPELQGVGAWLTEGSQVRFGSQPQNGEVGGEWAFKSQLQGAPGNARYGISATGLDLFGPHDRFPGSNLSGQNNVGGMDFGLLSAGDDPTSGNKAVTGQFTLIDHSVTFSLFGFNGNPQEAISNVRFQYGTSLSEPSFTGTGGGGGGGGGGGTEVPEPATAALLGIGITLMLRRRIFRRSV